MKLLKTSILFGGLLALAGTLSAESSLINVNVPFSFVAGGKIMPAGSYSIKEPSNGGVLIISGKRPNSTALVLAVNAGPATAANGNVTFNRRGAAVVLSTISIPGGSIYSLLTPQRRTAAAVSVALPGK